MIQFLFYFVGLIVACCSGFWMGKEKESRSFVQKEARQEKEFAIVVHSYNQSDWALKNLSSIFEQEYENFTVYFFDDASYDGTYEKVAKFRAENQLEEKLILIRNEERVGMGGCLFVALQNRKNSDLVISLDAKDFLSSTKVLKELNGVFDDDSVWLLEAKPIIYPTYEKSTNSSPFCFYAALFKEIRLSDLMNGEKNFSKPLLQMAKDHIEVIENPFFFENSSVASYHEPEKKISSYSKLTSIIKKKNSAHGVDLLIFSYNRPLQLYACLESVSRYFIGYEKISVLCRSDDDRFFNSYKIVENAFPHVQFVHQSEKKDFKPLLLDTVFKSKSPYIFFGVDDQIATDFVDLKECARQMEKTNAFGFYLRLGKHITFSYQMNKEQIVPTSMDLRNGIFAWPLKQGSNDWDFPHTVDMTIYRKKDLEDTFRKLKFKTPNSLEFAWAKQACPKDAIGLYFAHAKVVNTPLNVVGKTGNPHMDEYSVEDLLAKFEEGLKIDINPLYKIDNSSPHIEYTPLFTERE